MNTAFYLNLKNFDKLNRVGKGSFGDVYLLKSKKSNEIYAGKYVINSASGNTAINDLIREINIISNAKHPSIAKFIGICQIIYQNKRNPVIVTEYLPNGSLEQMINLAIRGNSPEKWDDTQKLIILYGIASGMAFLHSKNILRRDLKPANILLDEYLCPKICDIGLSKEKKSSFQSTFIPKGTPLYMAPEIFKRGLFSKASDVYSFAIITYQVICDEKPIQCPKNVNKLVMRVKNGKRYSFDYPINKSYRNLIKNCWNQDIEKRFTFEQVKNELKTDPGFITETVDEKQFRKYVDFIDNRNDSYDSGLLINILNLSSKEKNDDVKTNEVEIAPNDFPNKIYKKLDQDGKDLVYEAIKENNPEAQFCISINFLHRANNFPKNSQLGIKFLKMAADNGNVAALKNYCRKVVDGDLISDDIEQDKEKIAQHVDDNDPEIFLLLGLFSIKENNVKDAEMFLEKASNGGSGEAMYEMGMIYFNQCNYKTAKEYFEMAKKKGYKKIPPNKPIQPISQSSSNVSKSTSSNKQKSNNALSSTSSKKTKSKKCSNKGLKKSKNQKT